MTRLTKPQAAKLATIVAATASTAGMIYLTEKSVQVLVDANYAECNNTMTDPDDAKKVAVRATQSGTEYEHDAPATAESTEPMNTEENKYPIMSGRPIPAIKRTGTGTSEYPFDGLAVGQSFFVPATEAMPNPGKSLASTVSSASKRYATENGTRTINRKVDGVMTEVQVPAYDYSRKFMVRSTELEGVKGAEVFRIALDGDDAAE